MRVVLVAAALAAVACQGKGKGKASGGKDAAIAGAALDAGTTGRLPPPARPPKVPPPLPVAAPPPDAETITGVEGAPRAVIHVKRLTAGTGERPGKNDNVTINFTGWRTSGETFVTTTARKRPVIQSLALVAPGFAATIASMRQGERAMAWIPPELGYTGPPVGAPETTVYEIELVDIERGPPTPPDVAGPPPGAKRTAAGIPYVVFERGTGKVKPRPFDVVTVDFSAWSSTGRLFDSTELTKQPKRVIPFTEPLAIEQMLTTMVVGQRVRMWLPADVLPPQPNKPAGQICYELELLDVQQKHEPPPVPPSVAAPPPGAKQTSRGVFYEVLKPGTGTTRPTMTDVVTLRFTGWLTSGRLYDSSEIHGRPSTVPLAKLIPGWADAMQEMVPGERRRLWIPVELAYNHRPGLPPGMLVIETELLEINPEMKPASGGN